MSRHISDRPHSNSGARLREFTRQERESGVHPAIQVLRTRAQARSEENRKAAEYVRIDRGRLT